MTLFLTVSVKVVNLVFVAKMDSSGKPNGFSIELLTQSIYKIWKSCMESFLVGEELWSYVDGVDKVAPGDTPENANELKKSSISHALFDHILSCKSAAGIWTTLDGLFNKEDVVRLQMLEN
ncbi:hypothetical protein RHMOL_Rhmol04G0126600 [Rhododendron molle]|uniref:Uncharacterized protein n=1 Tax=Rhododendron molle TaxID=49168 RepID=A0ACC0P0X5_RHOML|nr:hypothetical protein RHMOL_Rhmol04G0126600 [Rhododendron molle]